MNQTDRTALPDFLEWLKQESYASWEGLASPLRALPNTATLSVRHTPLTDLRQTEIQRMD